MARAGETEVTRETRGTGVELVHVDGELDLATVGALERTIEDVDAGTPLVIDLSHCTFLDSSAVRVLVSAARAARESQGRASLVVTDPGILRVLEIAAVQTLLPVHDTVAAALESHERRSS